MPRGSSPMEFTAQQQTRMLGKESHAELARAFGCSDMPIRRWRRNHGWRAPVRASSDPALNRADILLFQRPVSGPLGTAGVEQKDGVSTVTSPPIVGGLDTNDAEGYLRKRWGFPADKWHCVVARGNEWQGGNGEGGTVTYAQVRGSFTPLADIAAVLPRPAVWQGPRLRTHANAHRYDVTHQIVIVADPQAPYHNEAKHAATCAMIRTLQPARIGHIGDLCDYTNISKHADHAVVKAAVDECTDAGVAILEDMREAAPDARFEILAGNHDVRPFTELLLRAERMAGIRTGNLRNSPGRELLSFRELWRLDELGIELVEDERGWQHAELDLIPGPRGLAAMHGYIVSNGVAAKSLEACGRSVIVAHTHRREHVYVWNKLLGFEQQAAVCGCSCETRGGGGKSFPTFAPRDNWTPGDIVVTVHPDGEFAIEHARWTGESLILGAQRWTP